jgi:KDO2-lipid IV(A) lauroyltransferase
MFKTLQYKSEYLLFLILYSLVRVLPLRVALRLGSALGTLIYFAQPRRRSKARQNLRRAFPEKSEEECRTLLRENFRQLGIGAIEMLRLDLYREPQTFKESFNLTGIEHVQEALTRGQGCFLLTGHVGFWEAGSILMPLHGISTDAIYKHMKNPYVEKRIMAMREVAGTRWIEKKRAARKILRSLHENRAVAVLIDQRVSPLEGVIVNFFNRPVIATPIIALMAIKQGTPIIPTFSWRLPDQRYEIDFAPMITFPQEENPSPETVIAATQLLTEKIEEAVRKAPEQWFWVHDRWRL